MVGVAFRGIELEFVEESQGGWRETVVVMEEACEGADEIGFGLAWVGEVSDAAGL